MNCSICKNPIDRFGHNAQPFMFGRCCDTCNITKVIPKRMEAITEEPVSCEQQLSEIYDEVVGDNGQERFTHEELIKLLKER